MNKDFDKQSSDKLQAKKRDKIRTIVLSLLIMIFFKGLAVTANNQLSNESLKNIKVETVNSWNHMKNYNNKSFKDQISQLIDELMKEVLRIKLYFVNLALADESSPLFIKNFTRKEYLERNFAIQLPQKNLLPNN